MIITGCETRTDELKEIWRECFHDPEEYIDFFFCRRYRPEDTVVYIEDGKAVSVIYALRAWMKNDDVYRPIRYLYAVSTLQAYRSRGYSTELLEYCNKKYPEGTVLVPASEGLFKFYKNCGYHVSSFSKIKEYSMDMIEDNPNLILSTKVEASAYQKARDSTFDGNGYVVWGEEAIQYALDENEFTGGRNVKVTDGTQCFYLLVSYSQTSIFIKESTSMEEALVLSAAKVLGMEKGCQKVVWRKPASKYDGDPFAMSYGVSETEGYLALALD